jgi:hypothetical protein
MSRAMRRLATLALTLLLAGSPALAQPVSAEAVKEQLTRAYGVEILRVEEVDIDGTPSFAVHVMRPAGDLDGALSVATLLVDARTGKLMSSFRHAAAGYVLPPDIVGAQPVPSGDVIRERSLR